MNYTLQFFRNATADKASSMEQRKFEGNPPDFVVRTDPETWEIELFELVDQQNANLRYNLKNYSVAVLEPLKP